MKTKKRFFLLAFSALIFVNVHTANAQVTIGGETAPVTGATLDLSPTGGYRGGLKLPNVVLTSLTEIPKGTEGFTEGGSVTKSELVGTVVYNSNAVLGTGMYMWDGAKWRAMLSTESSSSLDNIYPVGSIYMSVFPTNPATLFGGTWAAWGQGRVPVGVAASGTFNSVEKTGGAETHTLTIEQIPNATGRIQMHHSAVATNIYGVEGVFTSAYTNTNRYFGTTATNTTANSIGIIHFNLGGGGQAHNNLQPYITCYMWKRTN